MLHRHEFHAMASRMLAIVESESAPGALADVPIWFEQWEQVLSRFRSDSELCQLNADPGSPRIVSDVLWDVHAAALDAAARTGGLVTPLVLEALLYAGYDRSFDFGLAGADWPPEDDFSVSGPRPDRRDGHVALSDIQLDPALRTICLPRGALLDFGGVAKGWSAHQAATRLGAWGPALVSAGGDIAVSGPRADGGAWQISVEDPFNDGLYVDEIFLTHGGVATSGKDRRRWMHNRIPQHHIIDPRTGLPAETDVLTATVIAESAIDAEALAKAVLISGSRVGLDWLDSEDDLAGILILDSGQRLCSRNMDRYL